MEQPNLLITERQSLLQYRHKNNWICAH